MVAMHYSQIIYYETHRKYLPTLDQWYKRSLEKVGSPINLETDCHCGLMI